jgi:predicted small metal-binding protein
LYVILFVNEVMRKDPVFLHTNATPEDVARKVEADEVRGDVVRHINTTHFKLTTSITNNLLDQMRAQTILPSSIDPPTWIAEPPTDWPADELLATQSDNVRTILNDLRATMAKVMADD